MKKNCNKCFAFTKFCIEIHFPCHRLQRKPLVSDSGIHHGTCGDARAMMHVGIVKSRWRGKRSRHSRRMRNPQFCVSGKRPIHTSSKGPRNHRVLCLQRKWLSSATVHRLEVLCYCLPHRTCPMVFPVASRHIMQYFQLVSGVTMTSHEVMASQITVSFIELWLKYHSAIT